MNELIRRGELCKRLDLKAQTVYNMIHRKELILNLHYFKPTKKILLFDWGAIQEWLRGGVQDNQAPAQNISKKPTTKPKTANFINI
jgi:hypothetical protein